MRFWMGVTDNAWFATLQSRGFEEINFWQPSPRPFLASAPPGMPFLFKLKRPHNHVAGGGFFIMQTTLPLNLAWEIFGQANGADSFDAFRALLAPFSVVDAHQEIGCTLLSNPVFLPQEDWLGEPIPGWSPNIVRGKSYDTVKPDGARIWQQMRPFLVKQHQLAAPPSPEVADAAEAYGAERTVLPRLGQQGFRIKVTEAYRRRCAVTEESTLIALEAAHIVPYSREQRHDVSNGLLLRADFHRLFDAGLVGVDTDYRIRISGRIRDLYYNGKSYYRLDGKTLENLPSAIADRPDRDRLDWHMKHCFQP